MSRSTVLAIAGILALSAGSPAQAQMSSVYTDLDAQKNCTVYAVAEDGDGDWADLVCDGWRGYPVLLQYGDARESLFYGYPPTGNAAPIWESFASFNNSGPKIEWRLEQRGDNKVPVATIHRWFVSSSIDSSEQTQVLVVEKVGQPGERDGCAVAYVVATGNENANEKARSFADNLVPGFACGADQPAIDSGSVPLPDFMRSE